MQPGLFFFFFFFKISKIFCVVAFGLIVRMVFTRPCVAVLIPDRASDPDGYVNPPFLCFNFLLMLFFFSFFLI